MEARLSGLKSRCLTLTNRNYTRQEVARWNTPSCKTWEVKQGLQNRIRVVVSHVQYG